MADQATLQTWLDAAEQAQQDLLIGVRAVTISSASGKSVTYAQADAGKLAAYIASLKRQLGLPGSPPPLSFQVGGH